VILICNKILLWFNVTPLHKLSLNYTKLSFCLNDSSDLKYETAANTMKGGRKSGQKSSKGTQFTKLGSLKRLYLQYKTLLVLNLGLYLKKITNM
jgi:hypothetical protein